MKCSRVTLSRFLKKMHDDNDLNSWKAFMSNSEIENIFLTDFLLCCPIS